MAVDSPTLENFQTYGLDTLDGLATLETKVDYEMKPDRLEGKGKVFHRKLAA